MKKNILNTYSKFFKRSIQEVSKELLDLEFHELIEKRNLISQKKILVIIGMTGDYQGRFLLESSEETAETITEIMNYAPLESEEDLYLYMGEFANILSGRLITYINNSEQNKIIRLSPPAIFSGRNLKISTDNIEDRKIYYGNKDIYLKLDLAFKGVE
ncbi:chemotaxis protein CheX [Natronospora cellulosivora (SeqCode)]